MIILKPKISWKVLGYIILLSVIIGLFYNYFSSKGIDLNYNKISESKTSELSKPNYDEIQAVNLEKALEMFNEGDLFIDARDKWEFADGHIAGAVNFPYVEFEPDHPMLKKISKQKAKIIYCSSQECGLSTKLAIKLTELGYKKIFVMTAGWEKWKKLGFPISEGNAE